MPRKRGGDDDDDDVMLIDSDDDDAMDDQDEDEYQEEAEDGEYVHPGEAEAEEEDEEYYDPEEAMAASPVVKKSSSSTSKDVDKGHAKTAEDEKVEERLKKGSGSATTKRILTMLPAVYNRDRTEFATVEGYNAYQEQILRYTHDVSYGDAEKITEIEKRVVDDEKFDQEDIFARNRKRAAVTNDELLVSKRRYIMEEQKRLETRRNTRIDLIYAVSQPGTTVLSTFTQTSIDIQNKIVKANEATLNPQMGTGKRRNVEAKAFYQPRAPSQADAQSDQSNLPKILVHPLPRPAPMNNTATLGSGWKTGSLVELYLHEALGGLKVGEMPPNGLNPPAAATPSRSTNNTFRFPGGSVVQV
eukprot:TRINITY_DN7936_c0_g1_i1.p1 TRINITY_DN7936_c0_g1~~TRINITY_DN7936_c0_g1_i1.p1  ORF type:complete len:358 (+),score=87.78 TRINITY_DN7936_c0_g1_i1:43-1116(+)